MAHSLSELTEIGFLRDVMQRVQAGGHDVPDEKLEARFPRTRRNALEALRIVDVALVIDNSSVDLPFVLVEVWRGGRRVD